jgi:hypothetical protein
VSGPVEVSSTLDVSGGSNGGTERRSRPAVREARGRIPGTVAADRETRVTNPLIA